MKQLPPDFTVLKQLGEGGYGLVFLIQHPTRGMIAFKKFKISSPSDGDLESMKKEADIHKNLHHPNILTAVDSRFDSEVCGLFLEYMEYGPVDKFLQAFEVYLGMETSNCAWSCTGHVISTQSSANHYSRRPQMSKHPYRTWLPRKDIGFWNGSYQTNFWIKKRFTWTWNSGIHSSRNLKDPLKKKLNRSMCMDSRYLPGRYSAKNIHIMISWVGVPKI